MSTLRHIRLVIAGGPLISALLAGQGPLQAASSLPPEVRDALVANSDGLDPIDVRARWDRVAAPKDGEATTQAVGKSGKSASSSEKSARFVYQGGHVYSYLREFVVITRPDRGPAPEPWEFERTFDGQKAFDGTASTPQIGDNPVLMVHDPEEWGSDSPDRRFAEPTYFVHAGYRIPATNREVLTGNAPISEVLYLIDQRLAAIDRADFTTASGRREFELQLTDDDRRLTFFLDPELNFAVRSWEERRGEGVLVSRTINTDFRRVGSSKLYLPHASTTDFYRRSDGSGPEFANPPREYVVAESISGARQEESLFTLEYPAGAWVTDYTLGFRKVTYQIPADRSRLDQVIENARQRHRGLFAGPGDRLTIILIVNAAFFSLLAFLVVLRWRRSRKSQAAHK